jgi:hypothetical protein
MVIICTRHWYFKEYKKIKKENNINICANQHECSNNTKQGPMEPIKFA